MLLLQERSSTRSSHKGAAGEEESQIHPQTDLILEKKGFLLSGSLPFVRTPYLFYEAVNILAERGSSLSHITVAKKKKTHAISHLPGVDREAHDAVSD